MKVRCIRLLNAGGLDVESSSWQKLGHIYHVMSIFTDKNGYRHFGIINRHPEGEWPQLGSHQAECFEVVSDIVPSNWRVKVFNNAIDISPASWQEADFYESFFDHDPATYPIFERERDIIFTEDPRYR